MHQSPYESELFSYWVVTVYDPSVDMFTDVFKSYGQNMAQEKLMEYLKKGVCATVKRHSLPVI